MNSRGYSPSERFDYLQKLIHELNVSNSREDKRQVLANLSSFAYNPINWEPLNKLNAIPMFLDCLNQNDNKLKEFAISGLCNICTDPNNNHKIFNNMVLDKIHKFLSRHISNERIVIPILTIFIYSLESNEISDVLRFEINATISGLQESNDNQIIHNLVQIYLQK